MARPTTELAPPTPGLDGAVDFVKRHLSHLACDEVRASENWRGGQSAADAALAGFEVDGYARGRNEVYPVPKRGASGLSPYIRHGLLSLDQVWNHVGGGPGRDVDKFRDELLWQEYARHWYARLGTATRRGVRHAPAIDRPTPSDPVEGWDTSMACFELTVEELLDDGWLVNQSRMWLASHWTVRQGYPWRDGEDFFFRHLLDGSRAANRLGWQWTTGAGSSKAYGFSRWQVEKRAPGLCASCDLVHDCPIESWPGDPALQRVQPPEDLRSDDVRDTTAGPLGSTTSGPPAEGVWLTAESLGDDDPALVANPDLPVVFVFDEPLLARLRLSSKRLIFLVETLAELATRRSVELRLGDPVTELAGRPLAVTFAPVPGFRERAGRIAPVELHPYRWLVRPQPGNLASFSAWRRSVKL